MQTSCQIVIVYEDYKYLAITCNSFFFFEVPCTSTAKCKRRISYLDKPAKNLDRNLPVISYFTPDLDIRKKDIQDWHGMAWHGPRRETTEGYNRL